MEAGRRGDRHGREAAPARGAARDLAADLDGDPGRGRRAGAVELHAQLLTEVHDAVGGRTLDRRGRGRVGREDREAGGSEGEDEQSAHPQGFAEDARKSSCRFHSTAVLSVTRSEREDAAAGGPRVDLHGGRLPALALHLDLLHVLPPLTSWVRCLVHRQSASSPAGLLSNP